MRSEEIQQVKTYLRDVSDSIHMRIVVFVYVNGRGASYLPTFPLMNSGENHEVLKYIDDIYVTDAYHSLSIERYGSTSN